MLIESRFQGPPTSGNGGYVCGRLAAFVDAPAVAVRLRVPPPLDTPLAVRRSDSSVELLDGDQVVAEARRASIEAGIEAAVGEPPSFAEAESAAKRFRGLDSHWYPSCFVCGPDRDPGDGLCIYPGPIEGRKGVAGPWIPDASLVSDSGTIAPQFLWAALDCPGGFAFDEPAEGGILLGELQAELRGPVSVGERCVLVAWELAHEGRKHHTATALFGETGECRGVALGTWFEVPEEVVKRTR